MSKLLNKYKYQNVLLIIMLVSAITIGFLANEWYHQNRGNIWNNYDNVEVQFSPEVLFELNLKYQQITIEEGNEFSVCLLGDISGNNYYITEIDRLMIGNNNSVSVAECKQYNYIGNLHSHPNNIKGFSIADISSYSYYLEHSSTAIDLVMSDINTFEFIKYNRNNLSINGESIKIEI